MGKFINLVRRFFEPAPKQSVAQEFEPKVVKPLYECGWSRAHFDLERDLRRMKVDAEREDLSPESLAEIAKVAQIRSGQRRLRLCRQTPRARFLD